MATTTESGSLTRRNSWRIPLWSGAALLLLLPWVAMRFTDEVRWSAGDFLIFGAMLLAVCGAYELATRMSASTAYRAAAGVTLATAFLIVWANLAVGFIGNPSNPANLMYAGVLLIGIVGAGMARCGPQGMAIALVATAIAQAVVALIALILGSVEGAVLTACLVVPWLVSAWLFRKAAAGGDSKRQSKAGVPPG